MKQTLQEKTAKFLETQRLDKIALQIMRDFSCGVAVAYQLALQETKQLPGHTPFTLLLNEDHPAPPSRGPRIPTNRE